MNRRTSRLVEAVAERLEEGPAFLAWLSAWLPVLEALGRLATTAGELAVRIPRAQAESEGPFFDERVRAEVAGEFNRLRAEFPDIGEFFFDLEYIDRMIERALDDGVTRAMAADLVEAVEERIGLAVAQLVTWGLEEEGPEFSVERLEAFIDGLEALLDEILERWVLPTMQDRWKRR